MLAGDGSTIQLRPSYLSGTLLIIMCKIVRMLFLERMGGERVNLGEKNPSCNVTGSEKTVR